MDILIAGTYTTRDAPAVAEDQELGRGIYIFPYNKDRGEAQEAAAVVGAVNPSWVCMAGGRLFAVSEKEECAELLEYEINNGKDSLHVKQTADLKMPGSASCHIEPDDKRSRLYLSDYGSGDFKVIDISNPGNPELSGEFNFTGGGPRRDRQEASHIHSCCVFGDILYAADLGNDRIYLFNTEPETPERIREMRSESGAGPRHMRALEIAGHRYLYVVNELNCTIAVYRDGEQVQILPLSESQGGRGELAADISISKDKYLYVSVRGTGEIHVFSIGDTGRLEEIQIIDVKTVLTADNQGNEREILESGVGIGGGIRSICLDQGEGHLIAADQQTGTLIIFDKMKDGTLDRGRILIQVPAPVRVMTAEV